LIKLIAGLTYKILLRYILAKKIEELTIKYVIIILVVILIIIQRN